MTQADVALKIRKFFHIYSEIFFTDSTVLGIIIAAATCIDWNTGLSGMLAIGSAYIFSKFTFPKKTHFEPFYYYNPLLVGLSIGVLFRISPLTAVLIFAAAVLTFVMTHVLQFLLKKYTGLPVLSIPFVLVSSLVYLATLRSSNLWSHYLINHPQQFFDFILPNWISGYLLSLGSIFFSKNIFVGICIAIALVIHSRIAFLLSLIGYYSGALITGEFNSTYSSTYMNLNYFNYILIAIAVGSIYLIPSFKSYIIAIFAVVVSYITLGATEVFFEKYSIPVFTLPFNITVLCFLFYTDIIGSRLKTYTYLDSPEANLDFHRNYVKRFGLDLPAISLPFSGEWKISQEFDDDLTHKSIWKYAYDFVQVDENGKQYSTNAAALDHYYSFGKPVLAPTSGTVVAVVNEVADNEIGSVNREQNWGNCVTIYDQRGFYVKICHLKKGSVQVYNGMYVETGQLLGYCGNSGYAPFPHIHIQLQPTMYHAAPTLEFNFEQVICDGSYHDKLVPHKGQRLGAMYASLKKRKLFELLLGDSFTYSLTADGKTRIEVITVTLDIDGTSCLTSGKSRLYFELYKNTFRFYKYVGRDDSVLTYLYRALPSLPLSEHSISWRDFLPLAVSIPAWLKHPFLLLESLAPVIVNEAVLAYRDNQTIHSLNTTRCGKFSLHRSESTVTLHPEKFIESVMLQSSGHTIAISRVTVEPEL